MPSYQESGYQLWKRGSLGSHYLSLSLKVEDKISIKVIETLTLKGVFIEFSD